jgi:site-specific recombinase XerD
MINKHLNVEDTIDCVYKYLKTGKSNTASSARALSRTVGTFITKFGIITPDEDGLKALANIMDDRKVKNTTRRFYIAAFKAWAEALGKPIDVAKVFAHPPPIEKRTPHTINPSKVQSIIDAPKSIRDRCILAVLFYCGIRPGELVMLRFDTLSGDMDIDLTNRLMHIRNHDMMGRERVIPIVDALVPYIEAWVAVRQDLLVKNGKQCDRFFISRSYEPMATSSVWSLMRNVKRQLGIREEFSPNAARRTAIITAVQRDIALSVVKEIFGLSDVRTIAPYTRTTTQGMHDAMNKKFKYDKKKDGDNDDSA